MATWRKKQSNSLGDKITPCFDEKKFNKFSTVFEALLLYIIRTNQIETQKQNPIFRLLAHMLCFNCLNYPRVVSRPCMILYYCIVTC